tara:strand:+ start:1823 stop:1999 length:177 start_codon:yes stop_codon:yes gene_type:complete
MTLQEYIINLSRRPDWELRNMRKALKILGGFLNSDDENLRLQAVEVVLKMKRQTKGRK